MTGTGRQVAGQADGARGRRRIEDVVIHSRLNDGTAVCLRTITPDDGPLIRDGVARLSAESRYLRFFSPASSLPDAVIDRLVDVDGYDHIAWGAICSSCPDRPAIGAEPDGREHYLTVLVAPRSGNSRLIGLDIATQPANLAAAKFSRDADRPVMSAPCQRTRPARGRT